MVRGTTLIEKHRASHLSQVRDNIRYPSLLTAASGPAY